MAPLGLVVERRGGHFQTYDQLRLLNSSVPINRQESGLVAFTLFYSQADTFGMRWTSTSINNVNWGHTGKRISRGVWETIHYAPETYTFPFRHPPIKPIELRNPVRNAVRIATGFSVFDMTIGND